MPPGVAVYAIGDIHGRADLLADLHDMIAGDDPPDVERRILVYLGDYIDRGLDSKSVIETIIENPLSRAETIALRGNHEQMLLDFVRQPTEHGQWLDNFGHATLLSYGVQLPSGDSLENDPSLNEIAVRDALVAAMPKAHFRFLESLRTTWTLGDYFFVHAGVRPGVALDAQKQNDMLWIRDLFRKSRKDHGKIIVHGHSATLAPEVKHNRIGIDTGAYASNRLTALVLYGSNQRFIHTT
jgi:serine/threonine protein phosphatase 1